MLNAEACAYVSHNYKDAIAAAIANIFPSHQLFDLPTQGLLVTLLAFPEMLEDDLAVLDDLLYVLSSHSPLREQGAYFRIIQDEKGERRELALPLSPDDWQGQSGLMVGPFADEDAAEHWLDLHLATYPQLVFDITHSQGRIYCDVFRLQASFL
ncbi:MAG: hypothetical protein R2865_06035 [Deinococcales bacterium]